MAKEKKKKTHEEKLAQQRLHKKEKYQDIKKDPEKYAIQKEKERIRYLKRKEQKKLKSIKDLTPRQQRQKRKKWKENRQRYVEKKKQARAVQQMLMENSPPTSDEEDTRGVRNEPLRDSEVDPLEGPSSSFIEDKVLLVRCYGIECNHGYHLGFMDIPEENVACEQEQLLQEFIETKTTTPELLDEITNSPKRADNAFETVLKETTEQADVGFVKESNLVASETHEGISHLRKIQALSDVRLDWSNTVFSGKQASNNINPSFLSNFEKFIKPTRTETTLHEFSQNKEMTRSTCGDNNIEEKKTMEESKENV